MNDQERYAEHFPPAPWHFHGQAYVGLFRADRPASLPAGLRPLFNPHWRVVALIRYQAGTLRYDELIAGSLARQGARAGVYIPTIWVDSEPSLRGGRRIWGLPKELATFAWAGDTVQISDAAGPLATLSIDSRAAWLPPLWALGPGIGRLDGCFTFFAARLWGRFGRSGLRLRHWSERFGYRLHERPLLSVAAKPFRATIPPPR
jgi:hypothetical protein